MKSLKISLCGLPPSRSDKNQQQDQQQQQQQNGVGNGSKNSTSPFCGVGSRGGGMGMPLMGSTSSLMTTSSSTSTTTPVRKTTRGTLLSPLPPDRSAPSTAERKRLFQTTPIAISNVGDDDSIVSNNIMSSISQHSTGQMVASHNNSGDEEIIFQNSVMTNDASPTTTTAMTAGTPMTTATLPTASTSTSQSPKTSSTSLMEILNSRITYNVDSTYHINNSDQDMIKNIITTSVKNASSNDEGQINDTNVTLNKQNIDNIVNETEEVDNKFSSNDLNTTWNRLTDKTKTSNDFSTDYFAVNDNEIVKQLYSVQATGVTSEYDRTSSFEDDGKAVLKDDNEVNEMDAVGASGSNNNSPSTPVKITSCVVNDTKEVPHPNYNDPSTPNVSNVHKTNPAVELIAFGGDHLTISGGRRPPMIPKPTKFFAATPIEMNDYSDGLSNSIMSIGTAGWAPQYQQPHRRRTFSSFSSSSRQNQQSFSESGISSGDGGGDDNVTAATTVLDSTTTATTSTSSIDDKTDSASCRSRHSLADHVRRRKSSLTHQEARFLEELIRNGNDIDIQIAYETLLDDDLFFDIPDFNNNKQNDNHNNSSSISTIPANNSNNHDSMLSNTSVTELYFEHYKQHLFESCTNDNLGVSSNFGTSITTLDQFTPRSSMNKSSGEVLLMDDSMVLSTLDCNKTATTSTSKLTNIGVGVGSVLRQGLLHERRNNDRVFTKKIWQAHENGLAVTTAASRRSLLIRHSSVGSLMSNASSTGTTNGAACARRNSFQKTTRLESIFRARRPMSPLQSSLLLVPNGANRRSSLNDSQSCNSRSRRRSYQQQQQQPYNRRSSYTASSLSASNSSLMGFNSDNCSHLRRTSLTRSLVIDVSNSSIAPNTGTFGSASSSPPSKVLRRLQSDTYIGSNDHIFHDATINRTSSSSSIGKSVKFSSAVIGRQPLLGSALRTVSEGRRTTRKSKFTSAPPILLGRQDSVASTGNSSIPSLHLANEILSPAASFMSAATAASKATTSSSNAPAVLGDVNSGLHESSSINNSSIPSLHLANEITSSGGSGSMFNSANGSGMGLQSYFVNDSVPSLHLAHEITSPTASIVSSTAPTDFINNKTTAAKHNNIGYKNNSSTAVFIGIDDYDDDHDDRGPTVNAFSSLHIAHAVRSSDSIIGGSGAIETPALMDDTTHTEYDDDGSNHEEKKCDEYKKTIPLKVDIPCPTPLVIEAEKTASSAITNFTNSTVSHGEDETPVTMSQKNIGVYIGNEDVDNVGGVNQNDGDAGDVGIDGDVGNHGDDGDDDTIRRPVLVQKSVSARHNFIPRNNFNNDHQHNRHHHHHNIEVEVEEEGIEVADWETEKQSPQGILFHHRPTNDVADDETAATDRNMVVMVPSLSLSGTITPKNGETFGSIEGNNLSSGSVFLTDFDLVGGKSNILETWYHTNSFDDSQFMSWDNATIYLDDHSKNNNSSNHNNNINNSKSIFRRVHRRSLSDESIGAGAVRHFFNHRPAAVMMDDSYNSSARGGGGGGGDYNRDGNDDNATYGNLVSDASWKMEASYEDDGDTSNGEGYDAWKVIEDEYVNGYGGGGTLPFLILGTSANDVDAHPHVLSPPLMESLLAFVPPAHASDNMWMKYSLVRDGATMHTLLQKARGSRYSFLAIETVDGEVFGSFTASPWRKNWNYFGFGAETFLWKMKKSRLHRSAHSIIDQAQIESEVEVYPYTGTNNCIQLCTSDRIAVGGGGGGGGISGGNHYGHFYGRLHHSYHHLSSIPSVQSSSSSTLTTPLTKFSTSMPQLYNNSNNNYYNNSGASSPRLNTTDTITTVATTADINYSSTKDTALELSGGDTNMTSSDDNGGLMNDHHLQGVSTDMGESGNWGFGLTIEGDLLHGTSSPCRTFDSPSLSAVHSDGSLFEIMNLELWTLTPCSRLEDAEKLEMSKLFLEKKM